MKNNFRNIAIIFIISGGILASFSKSVLAQNAEFSPKNPTENQLSKVISECSSIKKQLSKTHSTDALKRVNLGRFYESISNDLMAKLNARIALNRMDSSNLIFQTTNFSQNTEYFRENYIKYENELKKLEKMDCSKSENAKDFYAQLEKVRFRRKELNFNVSKIKEIANDYKKSFDEFKKGVK